MDRIRAALAALGGQPAARADQMPSVWQNVYTGLGTTGGDRTAWHEPTTLVALDDVTLANLWQADPIAKTVVEAIVDDGLRLGFAPRYSGESERDAELISAVSDLMAELCLEDNARLAAKSARACRGGGLVLVVNGGRMPAQEPLDDERVVTVDRVIPVDSRDLQVLRWSLDAHDLYSYTPVTGGTSAEIHASHVAVFPGIDTTLRDRYQTWGGWYRPVLQHVVETIRDFRQSWQSCVAMMQDGSQGVLSLPDLARTLAAGGRSLLETRLSLIQLYRWAGRIMPIDAGGGGVPPEDFRWVERSFGGIADLLHEHQPLVAQAADMPLTRLFGDFSTSGLSDAGRSSERSWLSSVEAWRRAHIQPPVERVIRMLARQAGASDPACWGIEWPSLEVLTSAETAALEKLEAETDAIRLGLGMPEEVILAHRYGQGYYSHTAPLMTVEELAEIEEVGSEEPVAEEPTAGEEPADEDPAEEPGEEPDADEPIPDPDAD
jgi:phage-related protein (TIGR01555 family)